MTPRPQARGLTFSRRGNDSGMEGQQLEPGQQVWIDGRRAILLEFNAFGAPIVRFEGERVTRVVPSRKLQTARLHSPQERATEIGS
jgi:hypothetical protein